MATKPISNNPAVELRAAKLELRVAEARIKEVSDMASDAQSGLNAAKRRLRAAERAMAKGYGRGRKRVHHPPPDSDGKAGDRGE